MFLNKNKNSHDFFSKQIFILIIVILFVSSEGKSQGNGNKKEIQIAFLANVHLQDIYGSLSDSNFKGVLNPKNKKNVLIRTMESQLQSTRIYNENYFAFLAALDDIASRNIKIVALPGDYTDDGQPLHVRGLVKNPEAISRQTWNFVLYHHWKS